MGGAQHCIWIGPLQKIANLRVFLFQLNSLGESKRLTGLDPKWGGGVVVVVGGCACVVCED